MASSLKLEPFADPLLALCIARSHVSVGLRRRGGNISVDLSLFVLLYNTNFMNKLKFNNLNKFKTQNNTLTVKISIVYKITPLSTQRKGWST